jgi:hypothetical protein
VSTRISNASRGTPATPVLASASHSRVEPLRGVAATMYEMVGTNDGKVDQSSLN